MFRKFTSLAMIPVLAVLVAVTAGGAQDRLRTPPTATSHIRAGNVSSATSTGWIWFHVTNCTLYDSGVGVIELVVYPQEGGSFYTTVPVFQAILEPACQTGNLIALYVYDTSGDWNQIYT